MKNQLTSEIKWKLRD